MRGLLYGMLFLGVAAIALLVGKVPLHFDRLTDPHALDFQILTQVRLPRLLLAFLSGGILALSGLLFQTLFRNPLTTPFTLGISSGATLGASLAILLGWGSLHVGIFSVISLFGFGGALSTMLLIYTISRHLEGTAGNRLILVGIALSYLYGAVLLLFYYLSDFEESFMITRYTMGSLLTVGYGDLATVTVAALLLLGIAWRYRRALKLLSVSWSFAFLEGVETERILLLLFLLISLSVGILVSITGPIGFVGLVVPHMVGVWRKRSVDALMWPTFYFGGLFLLLCDTLARTLPTAAPLPVGVVTSFIGGAAFIAILLKR